MKPEDNDDSDLKFSGQGKGRLIREINPNPEYKNMQVEIEEVLGKSPYPDHLLKAIGNGNIQFLILCTTSQDTGITMNTKTTTASRGSGIVRGPNTSVEGFLDC